LLAFSSPIALHLTAKCPGWVKSAVLPRANYFRSSATSRHFWSPPACRKGAKNGMIFRSTPRRDCQRSVPPLLQQLNGRHAKPQVVNFIQTHAGIARSIQPANAAPYEATMTQFIAPHSRTTCHDRITRNFPAAGFDHRGRRCRGISRRRGSCHRHIDARAGGQGVATGCEVSGHSEGGATLRKLRAV
jgi:hypothetical protein